MGIGNKKLVATLRWTRVPLPVACQKAPKWGIVEEKNRRVERLDLGLGARVRLASLSATNPTWEPVHGLTSSHFKLDILWTRIALPLT